MRRRILGLLSGLALLALGAQANVAPNPFETLLGSDDTAVEAPVDSVVAGTEWLGASTPSTPRSADLGFKGNLGYGFLGAEGTMEMGVEIWAASAIDSATTGDTPEPKPDPDDPEPCPT